MDLSLKTTLLPQTPNPQPIISFFNFYPLAVEIHLVIYFNCVRFICLGSHSIALRSVKIVCLQLLQQRQTSRGNIWEYQASACTWSAYFSHG